MKTKREAHSSLATEVAKQVWQVALAHAELRGFEGTWVDPSAGGGVFLDTAPNGVDIIGYDIHPMHPKVWQADFLAHTPPVKTATPDAPPFALIGNPPFGRRGKMAAQFVNHAINTMGAEFCCLIVPGVLTGYHGQRNLDKNIGIVGEPVFVDGGEAFALPNGKSYKVGHCRIAVFERMGKRAEKPRNTHPHFRMKHYCAESIPMDGWGAFIHWSRRRKCIERPADFTKGGGKLVRGTCIYAEPDVIERLFAIDWEAFMHRDKMCVSCSMESIVKLYAERYGWGEPARAEKPPNTHPDFRLRIIPNVAKGVPDDGWGLLIYDSRCLPPIAVRRKDFRQDSCGSGIARLAYAEPHIIERLAALDWDGARKMDKRLPPHFSALNITKLYEMSYGRAEKQLALF